MEASVYAVNSTCFGLHSRRILPSVGDLRKQSLAFRLGCDPLRSAKRNNCLRLSFGSTSMGRAGGSTQSLFGSSAKARLVRAQASGSCFLTNFLYFLARISVSNIYQSIFKQ